MRFNSKKYNYKQISGENLLNQNKLIDTYCKKIKLGVEYEIRAYKNTNSVKVLSIKDWWIKDCYDIYEDVIKKGGLNEWFDFQINVGNITDFNECCETIEGTIECFNFKEDFDKSIYFRDQLIKLKKRKV